MRIITRLQVLARAGAHRRVEALPAWIRGPLRRLDGPSRLDLRLDDLGGVGFGELPSRAAARPLEEWQTRVVDWFLAHGPVPVCVIGRPGNPLLKEMVRFCHRLEVPVSVRTTATSLGLPEAEAIIDGGARRVIVGEPTEEAFLALAAARASRSARVDLEAELHAGASLEQARALQAAGADGGRVVGAWRGTAPEPWPLRSLVASFSRTPAALWAALDDMAGGAAGEPGRARARGHCPIGARVVLDGEGASSCPWQPGRIGRDAGWAALAEHRADIAACTRECWHPEAL